MPLGLRLGLQNRCKRPGARPYYGRRVLSGRAAKLKRKAVLKKCGVEEEHAEAMADTMGRGGIYYSRGVVGKLNALPHGWDIDTLTTVPVPAGRVLHTPSHPSPLIILIQKCPPCWD